jgi:type II secretion system protein J
MNRRIGQGGFTLIEMLAASAMAAVLIGSLYASLNAAFKARRVALGACETLRRTHRTLDLIRSDLQSACVPNGVLAGGFVGQTGQGMLGAGSDDLSFYASAMDIEPDEGIGDIKQIEYACVDSGGGQTILERRITTNLLATVTPEPKREVICRGVRAFKVSYFDGTAWQDSWDSANFDNTLPKVVQVTLELESASGDQPLRITQTVPLPCGVDVSQTDNSQTDAGGGSP